MGALVLLFCVDAIVLLLILNMDAPVQVPLLDVVALVLLLTNVLGLHTLWSDQNA